MRIHKTLLALAASALVALPGTGFAAGGLVGDCVDCHTMHNSELGQPVTQVWASGGPETSPDPQANLLRMDCLSCHADPSATSGTVTLDGGSVVPQVNNTGTELAGGSFINLMASQRAGHNVIDLYPADMSNAIQYESASYPDVYGAPPGIYRAHYHGADSSGGTGPGVFTWYESTQPFDRFTCAGARGCHGTRSQLLSSTTNDNDTPEDPLDDFAEGTYRTGMAAITGAHHNSYDGLKISDGYTHASEHDGQMVADGYRFIPGLWGSGNPTTGQRWMNVSASSHNEYYGEQKNIRASCGSCHIEGYGTVYVDNLDGTTTEILPHHYSYDPDSDPATNNSLTLTVVDLADLAGGNTSGAAEFVEDGGTPEEVTWVLLEDAAGLTGLLTSDAAFSWDGMGLGTRAAYNSTMPVPNNSMSGFCSTCHLNFHSSGTENGSSGAFLRHPSDYVIPDSGEYAGYTSYNVTAPVARDDVFFTGVPGTAVTPYNAVVPGEDMVMCLSCHKAHASGYDYMLRFEYTDAASLMTAGGSASEDGCLACHTTKGILPEAR